MTGAFHIRTQFDRFTDPLVYTPGDNEWTDCHRANNGGYHPLERLAFDREVFFDHPGTTLGAPTAVTVPDAAYPENVTLRRDGPTWRAASIANALRNTQWPLGVPDVAPHPDGRREPE